MTEWNLSWTQETLILLRRAFLNISRDPRMVNAALGLALILGVIVGFLFFQLGHNQVPCVTYCAACMTLCMHQRVWSSFPPRIAP